MKINTHSLWVVAERHFRNHLKSKPQDDDEAALLAILGPMSKEVGAPIANLVLSDPDLPAHLNQIRQTFSPGIPL
ncbi:MAG: hypothetical protein WCH99_09265 [Verrucomicrobiota bacterium]